MDVNTIQLSEVQLVMTCLSIKVKQTQTRIPLYKTHQCRYSNLILDVNKTRLAEVQLPMTPFSNRVKQAQTRVPLHKRIILCLYIAGTPTGSWTWTRYDCRTCGWWWRISPARHWAGWSPCTSSWTDGTTSMTSKTQKNFQNHNTFNVYCVVCHFMSVFCFVLYWLFGLFVIVRTCVRARLLACVLAYVCVRVCSLACVLASVWVRAWILPTTDETSKLTPCRLSLNKNMVIYSGCHMIIWRELFTASNCQYSALTE